MLFSVEDRDRARARMLELAAGDERVVAGAVVGSEARGQVDRWSDLDLTFAVADGATVEELLDDWTPRVGEVLDGIRLFDLPVGPTVYRVFLLPGCLQLDLSFSPAVDFGPRGPDFKLLFGAVGEGAGQVGGQAALPTDDREVLGLVAHHAVRARFAIERERLWQAEYWVSAARDHLLELASRRRGLDASYGRSFDDLPPDLLAAVEATLVGALGREQMIAALGALTAAIVREYSGELPSGLEPRLRELIASEG